MGAEEHGERRSVTPQAGPTASETERLRALRAREARLGLPPGGCFQNENYVGGNTKVIAGVCFFCIGPFALLILQCPMDEREVYFAPDGRRFAVNGAFIA